jgi:hypothetical protein
MPRSRASVSSARGFRVDFDGVRADVHMHILSRRVRNVEIAAGSRSVPAVR